MNATMNEPKMGMGEDPTGWMLDSEFAKFLLLSSKELGYMAMLAYTFLHGT